MNTLMIVIIAIYAVMFALYAILKVAEVILKGGSFKEVAIKVLVVIFALALGVAIVLGTAALVSWIFKIDFLKALTVTVLFG